MRKRRRNLLLAGLVAVALMGALIWLASRPSEPVYNGKTLSEWSALLADNFNDPDAQEAIQQIGTNGIPTLVRMLRARDSSLKLRLFELAGKQNFVKLHFSSGRMRNLEAAVAFGLLGSSASNAVPELIRVLNEKVSGYSQEWTIDSLCSIGPAAKSAVPELLRILSDTNATREVRLRAMAAVVDELQAGPELVVPALIKCLKDPNSDVRYFAARALAQLGNTAKLAAPALTDALKDPNSDVSGEAELALESIDPEAAAKAVVQ